MFGTGLGLYDASISYETPGAPWWADIIQQGISTTPAIIAAAKKEPLPYYPGGGPTQYAYSPLGGQYPGMYPGGVASSGGVSFNPDGSIRTSGQFQISSNMLIIGGLVLALFMMSGKSGKSR